MGYLHRGNYSGTAVFDLGKGSHADLDRGDVPATQIARPPSICQVSPKNLAFCLVPFKSHPLVAPFRFLLPKPLSPHLANRCGGEGGPTARPAGSASQGSRDGRCHARTASPGAAFSHGLQDNAVRCWAAGENGAVDYACSWYCGGGACASCDGGKGTCRCRLCEARGEETILGFSM